MPEPGEIDRIPDKSVVLVEEDTGYMKDFYAHKVATLAAGEGKNVVYLTFHPAEDIRAGMRHYTRTLPGTLRITDGARPGDNLLGDCTGDLCIIDSFSSLSLDRDSGELMHLLSGMREHARKGRSFLLVSDMGVLPAQHEQLVRAMADGVIRFVALVEGDRIKRYMRVLKMRGVLPVDKMIPLTITDEGLQIDTRERLG